MSPSVNPITVEVVRSGLAHIANEMATVLRKTSYNMMIYEVRDYCVGIVDPEGNILSQNFGALPIFLADLGPAVVDGVRMHGRDGFQPGDVLIMNHPYVCGQHLNNVVVYTPFFHQGELVAFLAARAQVARIKPGKYEAAALFDSDGVNLDRPVPLKVKVEVGGGEMTIDFSEISDQVPGSINSGESGAVAAARVAFKSLVAPSSPIDEGCFRPLKIIIPQGKILSATPPAPVGNWSRTLPTVI